MAFALANGFCIGERGPKADAGLAGGWVLVLHEWILDMRKNSENVRLGLTRVFEESPPRHRLRRPHRPHRPATTDSCAVSVSRRPRAEEQAECNGEDRSREPLLWEPGTGSVFVVLQINRRGEANGASPADTRFLPDPRRTREDGPAGWPAQGICDGRSMTTPRFRFWPVSRHARGSLSPLLLPLYSPPISHFFAATNG
jgi:hypothetical protein